MSDLSIHSIILELLNRQYEPVIRGCCCNGLPCVRIDFGISGQYSELCGHYAEESNVLSDGGALDRHSVCVCPQSR